MSVAQRMSWMAIRRTTRVEDEAYCLFGLFGINMPTLYGEGENAFYRLQEEIMRTSTDNSLIAWTSPQHNSLVVSWEGIKSIIMRSDAYDKQVQDDDLDYLFAASLRMFAATTGMSATLWESDLNTHSSVGPHICARTESYRSISMLSPLLTGKHTSLVQYNPNGNFSASSCDGAGQRLHLGQHILSIQ